MLVAIFFVAALGATPQAGGAQTAAPQGTRLQVFLDCSDCFADYLREEITFVDFVRDRTQADVHVIITSTGTGSGGREYVVSLTGQKALTGRDGTLKAVTGTGDPEDVQRRQLLTTLRIGLLPYMARDGVPQDLTVDVEITPSADAAKAARQDPWNSWVFSMRGSGSFNGEESNRERQISAELSADRITPAWKTTFGLEVDQETEEFDLDDDDPVKVERRERDFSWLLVKALGEHWSAGARGAIESSTFDNIKLRFAAAPAIEFNVFPYSAYQRRQLRAQYAVGVQRQTYHEETLFGKLEETLPGHEFSVTYDQRERWGSVEGQVEWFQYLHDLSKSRLESNGEISWRILRGLSVSAEARASRIRDQISLRRRGATPEEVLLRLRELQSGYDYDFSLSLTYTFGSIFSSIVNPRFGQ
ncbi:MAG TPA: hypothetical protein VJ813_02300 [Vicinamibacterales bacterium]|nr:hypothetical protein [Vicinamibacterales bacterium]